MELKIKGIKPMFTGILTTTNRYESNVVQDGIIVGKDQLEGQIKEYQTVIAVGNSVREIKPGDVVVIDPTNYIKKKYDSNSLRNDFMENPTEYVNIPVVTINDEDCFLIQDRDVSYIITDYEEVETPSNNLIMPKNPTIIVD